MYSPVAYPSNKHGEPRSKHTDHRRSEKVGQREHCVDDGQTKNWVIQVNFKRNMQSKNKNTNCKIDCNEYYIFTLSILLRIPTVVDKYYHLITNNNDFFTIILCISFLLSFKNLHSNNSSRFRSVGTFIHYPKLDKSA